MLELSDIPIFSKERSDGHPFVIAGGPCAYNPEPLADIMDFFVIGEAEEAIIEVMNLYKSFKERGEKRRQRFLEEVARIPGVYVPSLYRVSYNDDGTLKDIVPEKNDILNRIQKRAIKDLG